MIRGHMATYPARRPLMLAAVASIAPQVEKLVVVLNEYSEIPSEFDQYANLDAIIPDTDLKDTGKFFPTFEPADDIFLVDDDIIYSEGYVDHLLKAGQNCRIQRAAYGIHGSLLVRGFRDYGLLRKVYPFHDVLRDDLIVDMLGTGVLHLRGEQMPPYSYMADAQRFTDIRFARWCFENHVPRICVSHRRNLVSQQMTESSIYAEFTLSLPEHVFEEVKVFGRKSPGVGMNVSEYRGKRGFFR